MLPAYVDETGINYQKSNGFFVDGPFVIICGMLVPEEKYYHTERLFSDCVSRLLGVKDWKKSELHATDIWNRSNSFAEYSEYRVKRYFEELLQLVSKLRLPIVVGFQQKRPSRKKKSKVEIEYAMYSLLTGMEHRLSELNQSAFVVCDEGSESANLQKLLYDRTKWRYNPNARKKSKYKTKYYFENELCFLIDQVHFVSSKESLLNQLVDHLTFILNRVFTYSYLKNFPNSIRNIQPDLSKVPVSKTNFHFFSKNVTVCYMNQELNDVSFVSNFQQSCEPFLNMSNPDDVYIFKDHMSIYTQYG